MNSLKRKLIVSIILIILCISNISPLVLAITNELQENTVSNKIDSVTENDIYGNEVTNSSISNSISNSVENEVVDTTQIEDSIKQFDVLLAGILNQGNSILEYSNIESVISSNENITEKNGIWIEKNSREYFLKLINNTCNANYTTDEDGFLEKVDSIENNVYIEKINQLIDNADSCIVISIEEHYKSLNSYDNEILDMIIENDEYVLRFENEDKESNISNIVVLNEHIYNNEKESFKNLNLEEPINNNEKINKFLEVFGEDYEISNNEWLVEGDNIVDTSIEDTETNEIIEIETLDTPINLEENNEDELILFDIVLTGVLYSDEEITIENIRNVNNIKPSDKGIWVEENSRNIILNFLNNHGAYTYSINEDGYLYCDNVIKNNPNLDFEDVTEVDLEIAYILNEETTLILKIDDRYLNRENGIITYSNLNEDDYVLTFDNDICDNRIVILNSMYFNDSTEYDLALSDRFVKKIFDFGYDIQLYSDTSKYGYMIESRNVYFGPSSTDYAKVGSVDANEKIYLLGQSAGWYHIQYHVGSTGTQKSGYVPISTVTNIVANPAVHEEVLIGGYRYANSKITIYSCDDLDIAVSVGSVFQGEGVSLIYSYAYSDSSKNYNISFVEYSTSSGTKRGYTYTSNLSSVNYNTSIARVVSTSSAYSGPDTSYVKLGGAYYNEYVAILGKHGNWAFVEYNTSSGRKRGYMSYSNLENCNIANSYNGFASNQGLKKATEELTVYGGPNSNYANIGTIFDEEVISCLGSEREYAYIEYCTANGAKRGYVSLNSLIDTTQPSIPNITVPSNFVFATYGTSGLGKELKYYKLGNGNNVVFVVFEQHGWEDAWASDGIELVNIAQRVINGLNNYSYADWSIYVVPYANPDGITNGYTNNGPGRCTITTSIDMNRSWPAEFKPVYTSRNYTGDSPEGCVELTQLKDFILNKKGTNANIILDIHGWLNKTYGDAEIGKYFCDSFGFTHSSTYGSGYLQTWGKSIGAKACLIELPKPSSSNDIITGDYSGKLLSGIVNMLNEVQTDLEGGIDVNEVVKVTSSPTLNVRSGPSTSYEIITTLNTGDSVTRIKRGVATNDGYTWDKIKLSDGTIGYVVTNHLIVDVLYMLGDNNEDIGIVKTYLCLQEVMMGEIEPGNNYFDEDFYNAIKSYQTQNNLTVNGYLDKQTVIQLGFEVNPENNTLAKTEQYNVYSKCKDNYINYGDFYGDISSLQNNYLYSKNHDEPTIEANARLGIISGEEEYNSLVLTEDVLNEQQKNKENTIANATVGYNLGLKNAGNNLRYFATKGESSFSDMTYGEESVETGLYKEDHSMKGMYFDSAISESEDSKNIIKQIADEVMAAAEELVNVSTEGDSVYFQCDLERGSKTGGAIASTDWYLAINNYRARISVNVERDRSGNFEANMTYKILDYYDYDSWEEHELNNVPVGWLPFLSSQTELYYLNKYGLARNYTNYATVNYTINWSLGERINNGAQISGAGM